MPGKVIPITRGIGYIRQHFLECWKKFHGRAQWKCLPKHFTSINFCRLLGQKGYFFCVSIATVIFFTREDNVIFIKISAKAHPVFYWGLYCNNITILGLVVLLLWISETWGKPGQAQQELIPVSVAWSPLEGQLPVQYFKHTKFVLYFPWVKLCPALPLSIQWNIKVTI